MLLQIIVLTSHSLATHLATTSLVSTTWFLTHDQAVTTELIQAMSILALDRTPSINTGVTM